MGLEESFEGGFVVNDVLPRLPSADFFEGVGVEFAVAVHGGDDVAWGGLEAVGFLHDELERVGEAAVAAGEEAESDEEGVGEGEAEGEIRTEKATDETGWCENVVEAGEEFFDRVGGLGDDEGEEDQLGAEGHGGMEEVEGCEEKKSWRDRRIRRLRNRVASLEFEFALSSLSREKNTRVFVQITLHLRPGPLIPPRAEPESWHTFYY